MNRIPALLLLFGVMSGCAAMRTHDAPTENPDTPKPKSDTQQLTEIREMVASMHTRMDSIENKLTSPGNPSSARPQAVLGHPSQGVGENVNILTASGDPEAGFTNDEAVQSYRKAVILMHAGKLPEAGLSFSSFVERFPDHPLAGSAQFNVGESYFRQNDFATALKEFSRVPTSYDRSSHVSHAIARMAQAEAALKRPQEAAKHREQLTALFPQSPAMDLSPDASSSNESNEGSTAGQSGSTFDPPPTAPIGAARPSSAPVAQPTGVQEVPLDSPPEGAATE